MGESFLTQIQGCVFRVPEETLGDEDVALEQASFIIECLSLYRLLMLRNEDKIGVQEAQHREDTYKEWLLPLRSAVETWIAGNEDDAVSI